MPLKMYDTKWLMTSTALQRMIMAEFAVCVHNAVPAITTCGNIATKTSRTPASLLFNVSKRVDNLEYLDVLIDHTNGCLVSMARKTYRLCRRFRLTCCAIVDNAAYAIIANNRLADRAKSHVFKLPEHIEKTFAM